MTAPPALTPRHGACRAAFLTGAILGASLLAACGGGGGGGMPSGPLTVTPQPALAGGVLTWRVQLPAGSTASVNLPYRTADLAAGLGAAVGGAACGGSVDYVAVPNSTLATGGSPTVTISVATCPNAGFEPNERFELLIDWQGGVTRSANVIVNTAAGGLNDSGITQCLDAGGALVACSSAAALPGQDGALGRDALALTNDDADGRVGFSYAASGGCITDQVTGLMWNGSHEAAATVADAQAQVATANAAALCGHDDWRLPRTAELLSLVDAGAASGARIDAAFAGTPANGFWAAEAAAVDTRAQWLVDFASGAASYDTASNPLGKAYQSRLVRGDGAATACDAPTARFTVSGGLVVDGDTGLMWQACADGQTGADCSTGSATAYASHAAALARAVAVNADAAGAGRGHADWRVPNRNELASLVNRSCRAPAIQRSAFPGTPSASFWTGSPAAAGLAWYVDFTEGELAPGGVNGDRLLRLVRGGQ
jgi:hypothetical protein